MTSFDITLFDADAAGYFGATEPGVTDVRRHPEQRGAKREPIMNAGLDPLPDLVSGSRMGLAHRDRT